MGAQLQLYFVVVVKAALYRSIYLPHLSAPSIYLPHLSALNYLSGRGGRLSGSRALVLPDESLLSRWPGTQIARSLSRGAPPTLSEYPIYR